MVENRLGAPGPDPFPEPLDVERADVLHLHPSAGQPVGVRADQHLACTRGLLEARRKRYSLTGREGRVALVDDDLTRLDARAHVEAELPDRVERGEPGTDRTLGVVLVRLRKPQKRHTHPNTPSVIFVPCARAAMR